MKTYVFYCDSMYRFIVEGENDTEAFTKLNRQQKSVWARKGEFCVEVPSQKHGRLATYGELLHMKHKQSKMKG